MMSITEVASVAALQTLTPSAGDCAYLTEAGREGAFTFDSSNLSVNVSGDPYSSGSNTGGGVYIPPSGTNGSAGAWVRDTNGKAITPFMFGAVGDGATDDLCALQAFNDWVFASVRNVHADFTGNFGIHGELYVGPSSPLTGNNGKRPSVGGELRVVQLDPSTFETCRVRYLNTTVFNGRITAQGIGGTSFASRPNAVGITFDGCALLNLVGGARAFNFWLYGIWFPSTATSFNDEMSLGTVRCYFCGSGLSVPGYSLSPHWSSPVQSGISGSTAQRVRITVDALPDASFDTAEAGGSFPQCQVRIAGYLYTVYSIDRTASTISVYPWLDNASFSAGSGTLEWVFGGAIGFSGSDSGIIQVGHLQAIDCGRAVSIASLYGPRINSLNVSSCGTGIAIGRTPESACIGYSIDAYYPEGNDEDIVWVNRFGGNGYGYIDTAYALIPSKIWAIGDPRLTSGLFGLEGGAIGSPASGPAATLAIKGRHLDWRGRNLQNPLTTLATFRDQRIGPRIYTQNVNSQTVTLTVQGEGEYNRLFGYIGSTWRYVGTGTNGAPTGTITFSPSQAKTLTLTSGSAVATGSTSGLGVGMSVTGTGIPAGTTVLSVDSSTQLTLSQSATAGGSQSLTFSVTSINGVSGSPVSFSGPFDGPVDFEILHTDTNQLVWIVRLVAGQSRQNTPALGYSAGAGAIATQATSKSTGVTLNKLCGQVTMNAAPLAAGAAVTFTLTNDQIAATDLILLNIASGATANGYVACVSAVAAGSCGITLHNTSTGSLSEAVVLRFAVFKAATS